MVDFDADWRFARGEQTGASAASFADGSWATVKLPHQWDNEQDPPQKGYYRGPGWYRKEFTALPAWGGKRVFVRFEAASLCAEVFLNGQRLGEHHGGFAAFCYELTAGLRTNGSNVLAVRVDNSRREDVIPLGGDFTVYGGIYRPVSLLITDSANITPLDYGSPGVFLRTQELTPQAATVSVTAEISNEGALPADLGVEVTVREAGGRTVARGQAHAEVPAHTTLPIAQSVNIRTPHLWNGVADPYLYSATVTLTRKGHAIDSVEQPLGLRATGADPHRGFLLNGTALQIRGVDRHQDWAGTGWAIDRAQQDLDLKLMREMGVTGVRLAHYQHNEYFYHLCDQAGLLVWAELPMVNDLRGTPEFRANIRQQLTELIRQNENHPSIVMWSLYNEISPSNPADSAAIVRDLKQLAKAEDPTRPTTGALSIDGIAKLPAVGAVNDLLALNVYPGWYVGGPDDMGPIIDRWNAAYGSHGIIISEYGGGASIRQHQQDFAGRTGRAPKDWHPEEWQAIVHERNYAAIRGRPEVYASFVWNMFDFSSAGRKEGDEPGINDKGLITRDRKIKKDAFFFYQANWTQSPMVHLVSSRDTPRTAAATAVKVYSNCARVRLILNGKDCGEQAGSDLHVFLWPGLRLQPGLNRVQAVGAAPSGEIHDQCEWELKPASS